MTTWSTISFCGYIHCVICVPSYHLPQSWWHDVQSVTVGTFTVLSVSLYPSYHSHDDMICNQLLRVHLLSYLIIVPFLLFTMVMSTWCAIRYCRYIYLVICIIMPFLSLTTVMMTWCTISYCGYIHFVICIIVPFFSLIMVMTTWCAIRCYVYIHCIICVIIPFLSSVISIILFYQ